ncbi:MAG: secretin N-terminal domain-containing protein [Planctomycetota bacterium]|jgi:type II secretory pathway component GspD/PulD (secretin)
MRIAAVLCGLALFAHAAEESNDKVKIEIQKEMELREFIDLMSMATAQPLVYDPNGQRIRNQKMGSRIVMEVPKAQLFNTFRAILTFYELTLIPVGPRGYEVHFVVDSRSTNNFIKNKAAFVAHDMLDSVADRDGVYIRTFVPIEHIENLTTLRTALSSMVSPAGIGRVHEVPGAGLILMDFAPTVAAMRDIIRRMDVPSSTAQVLEAIELTYANAKEVAESVQELYIELIPTPTRTPSRRVVRLPHPAPRITPFRSRNAVLVRATRKQLEAIRGLIGKLDQQENQRGTYEIVRLAHVDANHLAEVLAATLAGPATSEWPIRVVPDTHTRSILLNGDRNAVTAVKQMIAQLDVAPQN